MIRGLFVLFVTLGGFAALALWSAREDDARAILEEIVPPELRAAMQAEIARLGLREPAAQPPSAATTGAEEPTAPSEPARAVAEQRRPPVARPPLRESDTPGGPEPKPEAVAKKGAGGSAAPADADAEDEVALAELAAPLEFARDFGPASDRGTESTSALLPTGGPAASDAPTWDEPPHDAERSALLIRRMLAVYRAAGAGR
jgi:hypothetical protein